MLRTGFFAASGGGEAVGRPVLLGSDSGGSTSQTLTVSCVVPAECTLLVVPITSRAAGNSRSITSCRLGGVDMLVEIPHAQNTIRPGSALYYLPNPTPGSQSLQVVFSGGMNSNFAELFYFIGNPDFPFRDSHQDNSVTNGNAVQWVPVIDDLNTVLVAGTVKTNPTSSGVWTLTNVTESGRYMRGNEDAHIGSYNVTYDTLGATTFRMQCDGSGSYLSGVWGILNPIGWAP